MFKLFRSLLAVVIIASIISLGIGGVYYSKAMMNNEESLSNLEKHLKEEGSIHVKARFNKDHLEKETKIAKLTNYTNTNLAILNQVFTKQEGVSNNENTKLPYLYQDEIDQVKKKLSKYSFASKIKFNKFNNIFSFRTSNFDELKDFYNSGIANNIEEVMRLMEDTGQGSFAIDTPSSWNRSQTDVSFPDQGKDGTGQDQLIAIIDSGIENNHKYLYQKVTAEACFQDNNSDDDNCPNGDAGRNSGLPCNTKASACFHGTFMGGIAAGKGEILKDPSSDIISSRNGVAKNAQLFSVNVFSTQDDPKICGRGLTFCAFAYDTQIADALDFMHVYNIAREIQRNLPIFIKLLPMGAINMSLGGGLFTNSCDNLERAFDMVIDINELKNKYNVPTIISSGNGLNNDGIGTWATHFPGCISSAITVGSTNNNTAPTLSNFSNGRTGLVDIYAPGDLTYSSVLNNQMTPDNGILGGTSGAAASVSAAFAILNNVFPSLQPNTLFPALSVDDKFKVLNDVAIPFNFTLTAIRNPTSGAPIGTMNDNGRRLRLCKDYERTGIEDIGGVDAAFNLGTWRCVGAPSILTPPPAKDFKFWELYKINCVYCASRNYTKMNR
jgi:subtilisin family serine protease